ncbi:segregation/condensation protein A [Patescibacteria group bacterium]|nr:segregation/condensation protein A [Patescibacteria group bacterium]
MYKIKIQEFEGPLSLLLKLIEQEKLDITKVSLAQIADQYLERIDKMGEELNTAELADFLVVATRLLVIKSHILLPSLSYDDESADDLEHQLKMYKAYRDAADGVKSMIAKNRFAFSRQQIKLATEVEFSPPKKLVSSDFARVLNKLIKELEQTIISLPKKTMKKVISLSDRINQLRKVLNKAQKIGFKDFIKSAKNRAEVVVSFLALLELAKQRHLMAEQSDGLDILISKIK